MSRLAVLALCLGAFSCGNGSKPAADQQKSPTDTEEGPIVVPTEKGPPVAPPVADRKVLTQDRYTKTIENEQFHLRAEEGTLVVSNVEVKAGAEVTAEIKLAPATGWKVATDYPTKLQLMDTPGVKLDKTYMTAGGRAKAQGDAQTLSEQSLAFAVKATPQAAGAYEIKGVFQFGVCEKDSCHPKTQPITIQVAAN